MSTESLVARMRDEYVSEDLIRDVATALADATATLVRIRGRARAVLAVGDRATALGTHYEGCWVNHRDCFAVWVADTVEAVLDENGAKAEAPPAYLALDLWAALGLDAGTFDGYYDRNGWADTWATLLDAVRRETGSRPPCTQITDGEVCELIAGHLGSHMGASDVGSSEPLPAKAEARTQVTVSMIQRVREASAAQFGYYPTIEEATVIVEAALGGES